MNPLEYFIKPRTAAQKQYCALAAYFVDSLPAKEAARRFGYTLSSFYSLVQDFKSRMKITETDPFFAVSRPGRKEANQHPMENLVASLREKNFSNADIVKVLETMNIQISQPQIWRILNKLGYSKLPRRSRKDRVKSEDFYRELGKGLPCPGQTQGGPYADHEEAR